jgi:alanyl-tRNA synthetase
LGSFDGKKLSLVTACAEKTGVNASDLLKKHLAPFNARGGGDQSIAQGGGTAEDVDNLFNHSKEFII